MRLLLADELTLVRAGVRLLLERLSEPVVELLGDTGDGQELLRLVAQHRPDLVLLEHGLSGMSGQEATQQIRRHYPEVKVAFLTARVEAGPVRQAMHAGAVGYVVKDADPLELALALKAIAGGHHYLSPRVSSSAFDRRLRGREQQEGLLTLRQRQVLRLMGRGKSTKEIAGLMGVSVKTVETHRARTAAALGLYGVNALMCFAIKSGMDSGEF